MILTYFLAFALFLVVLAVIFVLVFIPEIFRFVWREYALVRIHSRIYKWKLWWERVRRRWARRKKLIWHSVDGWWAEHADDKGGLIIIVVACTLIGLSGLILHYR